MCVRNYWMKTPRIILLACVLAILLSFYACSNCGGSSDPNNTRLLNITLSEGTLYPTFDPEITEYTAHVGLTTKEITATVVPEDKYADVIIEDDLLTSNLPSLPIDVYLGTNTILVNVTSANKGHIKTYTITVTRGLSDVTAMVASYDVISSS